MGSSPSRFSIGHISHATGTSDGRRMKRGGPFVAAWKPGDRHDVAVHGVQFSPTYKQSQHE